MWTLTYPLDRANGSSWRAQLRNKTITASLVVLQLMPAYADIPKVPPPPTPAVFEGSGSSKELDNETRVGSLPVVFETTTLADVQGRTRAGRIAAQSEAGEAILWLCYSVTGRRGPEAIWVVSSAEMGGPNHAVTQVIGRQIHTNSPGATCPTLPDEMAGITIGPGVWLGNSVEEALKKLGEPTRISGEWYVYQYTGKVPGTCQPGGFDRDKWLLMRVKNGFLVEIQAGQTTTC